MSPPGRRVLIVEDQRLIAADLEYTLKKLGYQVAGSVASGEQALETAVAVQPDLVLMDIRLRGALDGVEAAALIRAQIDVPIIYLTAYADEATIARAKITSPFGYLVKPYNERELRAAIEIALYKHETDRLLAEERTRRQAAEELKLMIEAVKDYAIIMLNPKGRVATWNEGARRITGYAQEEILGSHISTFYPPEAASGAAAALAVALQEGRDEHEGWRLRKDGTCFWAHVTLTAFRDPQGRHHGFGLVTQDLTEQKRQSEALTASEELFRSFFNLATVGMGIVEPPTGKFIRVNAKLAEMTGYSNAELLRMTPYDLTHPDDRDHDRIGFAALLAGKVPNYTTEKRYVRKDRRIIWVLLNTTAVWDSKGQALRTVGVVQDITQLKRTEEELREAVRARDEFLQIASHELKTPLTPLQLQLDALVHALDRAGVRNERLSAKLEVATRQTARLNRLVENLLDVSRITGGRIALDLDRFDLAELVRDVSERFRSEAKKAGSALTVRADAAIHGRWDHLRVEQILSNLITNAIKYGNGKPIKVTAEEGDGMACVTVEDQGIGISEDALERIFQRFERAVSPRHFGGLGLGLFIAWHYAEAHGGTVVARSRPGAGAQFTLRLPREPRARPEADAAAPEP